MKNAFYSVLTAIILLTIGCKKDEPIQNGNPTTKIFVDKINRSGEERLNTVVNLRWSGEDKDGFVKGYEISFNNINWEFTTKQDSVFRFSISGNSDTTDIDFYVRAIDNDGNIDPEPAFLKIPIKNKAPEISFDQTLIKTDTVLSVFSVLWKAEDFDGFETLDSIFLKLNDGAWYSVSRTTTFLTIIPENPEQSGSQNAKIYQGFEASLKNERITNIRVNDRNTIYIKARDNAGSESLPDTLKSFYLKRKSSDLLIVDAHNINVTPNPTSVYIPLLNEINGNYDLFDLFPEGVTNLPSFWKPTFSLTLSLYDKVFWYGESTSINNLLPLELASGAIQDYLNSGGKILISSSFPSNLAKTSSVFQFSPVDSFATVITGQRIDFPIDSLAVPQAEAGIIYPALKISKFINGLDPFYQKSSAKLIYKAQTKTTGFIAPKAICAKSENSDGKTNQVFCSAELNNLLGDADSNPSTNELKEFFRIVLKQEFNW